MKNDFKALLSLIIAYTIGNFLLLFSRGLYWDAWQWLTFLKEKNYALMWSIADQSKLYTHYFLLRPLGFAANPIVFVNLISFASWLFAGLLLYGILRKKLNLPISRTFFISACYILIPTLLVKTGQSILHYSVNNLLFFLAAFIYFVAEKNKNRLVAALNYSVAWALFFFSFLTNSFLVFYGGFLALIFLSDRPKRIWPWLKNNFPFVILPIAFWILKIYFLAPKGSFAGYNQFIAFNSASLIGLIHNLWQNIAYGFFWPIIAPIAILDRKIFAAVFLIIFGLFYFLLKKVFSLNDGGLEFPAKKYFGSGLLLFVLGMIPYLLVGKAPQIFGYGFAMRHALLLPLGSSLIILGTILALIKERWQFFVQVLILALFATFTVYNYYWQDMDWYQQQAVIESLKEAKGDLIKNASLLVFYDQVGIRWQNRNITSGEYLHYVQSAFPKNNIQLVSAGGDEPAANAGASVNSGLNGKTVKAEIISKAAAEIFTVPNWLKIKEAEIFSDRETFLKTLKDIYQTEVLASVID